MEKNIKQKYTSEFKFEAITRYMNGENPREIGEELKMLDYKRIYAWHKKYLKDGAPSLVDNRGKHLKKDQTLPVLTTEEELAQLRAQVLYLKKQLSCGLEVLTKAFDFEFIVENINKFKISTLLAVTTVSESGYYRWVQKKALQTDQHPDEVLRDLIIKIEDENAWTYGVNRIKDELLDTYKQVVNHKRIRRIMHKFGLICKLPKPKHKRRKQPHGKIKNILNREFETRVRYQKLCLDITYIRVNEPYPKWVYVCAVKDLYNGEIIAYDVASSQNMAQIYRILEQLGKIPLAADAILHSDQGFQFTSPNYIKKVADMGITQSMSRRGNCWDNACIENFFRHLKAEMPLFSSPQTFSEVQQSLSDYIQYFNTKRIQSKLGTSPVKFALRNAH
ncbi:MAG: IS3 family transposase, partial [Culicoidibacterales bacterium]